MNLDIRFGPDVYRIPVGVNATCDEKRRHLQGVMPEGMLGQGCTNRACAALVTLAELLPSCAAYCEAAMGDAKLERTSTVEPGALWRGSPGGAVTSLKGQRFEAVARAFLGAHGYASAGGAAEPLAKLFEEQNRFDPKYADLGEVVLYELAHAEARVRPPTAWFDDLRTVGWHRMPGADRLSLFPESRVAQARRALEAVTGHVRFNFLGGRGTDASTRLARGWVERFALAHFRADDVLVFTDSWQAHAPLGPLPTRTLDAAQPKWNPKLANNVSFIRDAMTSPARDEWVAHLAFLGRGRPPPPRVPRRRGGPAHARGREPRGHALLLGRDARAGGRQRVVAALLRGHPLLLRPRRPALRARRPDGRGPGAGLPVPRLRPGEAGVGLRLRARLGDAELAPLREPLDPPLARERGGVRMPRTHLLERPCLKVVLR